MPRNIAKRLVIALAVYLAVSLVLVLLPFEQKKVLAGLDFAELDTVSIEHLSPDPQAYQSRSGDALHFREFLGSGNTGFILLHGSGTEGRYLSPLANFLQQTFHATVLVPDLRGHGHSTLGTPGDVKHLGQLEEDIEDLLAQYKHEHPDKSFYLLGHSSGGGLALKLAASQRAAFEGYVLLAPFLGYRAPMVRPSSAKWVQVSLGRFAGISALNRVGIDTFNKSTVMYFNRPTDVEDPSQTKSYSYRMSQSFSPQNYAAELQAVNKPLLLLVGSADEAFIAEAFEPVLKDNAPRAELEVLAEVKHLDIVTHQSTFAALEQWLHSRTDQLAENAI